MTADSYTPATGRFGFNGAYDLAIATLTRERRWRGGLVGQIAPKADDVILDIGCGTGSLAILLKQAAPAARIIGLDPDPGILDMARAKADRAGVAVEFRTGFARDADVVGAGVLTKVVSSLVFHQTPLDEKRAGLTAMLKALRPGGELHVADYGLQRTPLMRMLFRQVQLIDGFADTEPNARGVLPELMAEVGFDAVAERQVTPTVTGSISLYFARRRS